MSFQLGKLSLDDPETHDHCLSRLERDWGMTDSQDAIAALESARIARSKLASRTRCPAYMHFVFGGLLGCLVASEAASDKGTLIVEAAVASVGLVIFFVQRRKLGFFINGYRRGRTRPVALAVVGVYLLLFSLAAFLKAVDHLHWPALALGVVMFGLGAWGSAVWQSRYQAEMAGELGAA